jgi:hypothetical protein
VISDRVEAHVAEARGSRPQRRCGVAYALPLCRVSLPRARSVRPFSMVDMNQTHPPRPNARRSRWTPIVYRPMGAVVAAVAALVGLRPTGGAFVLLGCASLVPEPTGSVGPTRAKRPSPARRISPIRSAAAAVPALALR